MNCIFCKIALKDIPAQIVFENDTIVAFNDINPSAPVHVLVIPKKHIASVEDISVDDGNIISSMFEAVKEIAVIKGLSADGYRLIINNGSAAGQEVFHLHMHILGGMKKLGPMLSK